MKIGVIGLGHFAGVVAVCLADSGHGIGIYDFSPPLVRADQRQARDEQGWVDLEGKVRAHIQCSQSGEPPLPMLSSCDLLWIAYDVPLFADGAPDPSEVNNRIKWLSDELPLHIPFLISCQWPVGSTRYMADRCPGRELIYVMENVRVGKAVADFYACPIPLMGVKRLPVHVADNPLHSRVWKLVDGLPALKCHPLIVSWESAEMAKHATNAFMALQIAFANEIARLCAGTAADPQDVMRGVMSDARVSPSAPLKPGGPFGGGSLKRDLLVLQQLIDQHGIHAPILRAILPSNEA